MSATPRRSTCTSSGCAPRSRRTPPSPAGSPRSGGWATSTRRSPSPRAPEPPTVWGVGDQPPTGWVPLRDPGWRGAVRKGLSTGLGRNEQQQAFYRLALTHALAAAGDAIVTVSLAGTIFFTTSLNGARPKLVLSLLLTMAPFAVVAPFLGPAIDRSRGGRRLMIVASAAGRAVVCLYMATVIHGLMLYPCALAILVLSKGYSVAKSALVPATVANPAQFVRAGGRLAVIATIGGLVASLPA